MLGSLNFKHIYYFWIVAKQGSIQKASLLLNVSSSSISEQIKTLEGRVGTNLFDPSIKKMTLTSQGKVIFNKLDASFPEIIEVFESIMNHKHPEVKVLRIGYCPTLSKELKFKLCFDLIEDPYYTVKVLQGQNSFLTDAFNRGDIEMLFSTNDKLRPKGSFSKFVVGTKKFSLVCNSEMYSSLDRKKSIDVIKNQKIINFTADSELHFRISKLINSKKIHPIRVAEIDDIDIIKKTIIKFNTFAFLPNNAISEEIKNGTLKNIICNTDILNTNIIVFYKKNLESKRFFGHLSRLKKSIL